MTTHTLDSLAPDAPSSLSVLGGDWVATCSCHNPDGNGVGRADFRGDTALDAVRAWQEHVASETITIPVGGEEPQLSETGIIIRYIYDDDADEWVRVILTVEQWDRLRGAR